MPVRYYPASSYIQRPWKNGVGQTDEIYLMPKESTRDSFDIRVSSAAISEPGVFSPFPGVDRVITVIRGHGLSLSFESGTVQLPPFQPFKFDSTMTPFSDPGAEETRVLNVMVNRAKWTITDFRVLTDKTVLRCGEGGLIFVFAANAPCRIRSQGHDVELGILDTAFADESAEIIPQPSAVEDTIPRVLAGVLDLV
ncbi:HutD family protein [Ruegeria sp.]|uniref:HutD/Ves family protein n=1 Tax=Ruegeria sp. TaxID=1879320 RepID=UPI003C7CA414